MFRQQLVPSIQIVKASTLIHTTHMTTKSNQLSCARARHARETSLAIEPRFVAPSVSAVEVQHRLRLETAEALHFCTYYYIINNYYLLNFINMAPKPIDLSAHRAPIIE
jgi:hypothetical protein